MSDLGQGMGLAIRIAKYLSVLVACALFLAVYLWCFFK